MGASGKECEKNSIDKIFGCRYDKGAMKSKEFSKDREFAVILEKIHTDMKMIIEDLGSVKKKVEAIFDEQGRQREDISIIKAELKFIKNDIAEIKVTLKDHAKRLSQLEIVK